MTSVFCLAAVFSMCLYESVVVKSLSVYRESLYRIMILQPDLLRTLIEHKTPFSPALVVMPGLVFSNED